MIHILRLKKISITDRNHNLFHQHDNNKKQHYIYPIIKQNSFEKLKKKIHYFRLAITSYSNENDNINILLNIIIRTRY